MFENGKIWMDDAGRSIQAHGGCILQHDGMWYWYGEHKGAENCPGTTRVDVIGISCYSSKDMNSVTSFFSRISPVTAFTR